MRNLVPIPPGQRPPLPDFTPVPRKYRYDGWTPERQRAFIHALAETGSVKAAAQRINMAKEGAYYLRRQPGAEEFRAAWDAALDFGVQQLADLAIDRAVDGVPIPIFYKGEQVSERRWYNDRLLMFILKHHMPSKYRANLAQGTKHPDTLAREAAEAEADDEASLAALRERVWGLMKSTNRDDYERCVADPAKRAAWELLNERPLESLIDDSLAAHDPDAEP